MISLCFALPFIYIIQDKLHKFDAKIDLLKNFTKATRVLDLDNDGYTEELSLGNIDKDNFYGEVWNHEALLGVINDRANVLKNTIKVGDLDKDSLADFCYLSFYKDTLFLKSSEIHLQNNKIAIDKKSDIVICALQVNDAQPEFFKSDLIDVDGDGFDEYVFTIFHSPKHRCLYYYNFKTNKLFKSNNEFMVVTDFHKLKVNSKNVILYTTYANGNIPKDRLKVVASKYKMDSLHSDKYFSDEYSYIGYFNEKLLPVGKPNMREGFTSMIRAVPVVKGKEIIYFTTETYINEPDSLQTLKVLDQNLNTLLSKRMLLPYRNDLYSKYNKEVFQKIEIKNENRIILCGRNDSVYELSPDLKLTFLFNDANVKEGTKVKQIDLNDDGEDETIFFGSGGLVVFSNGLDDKTFVESSSGINVNAMFDKSGKLEKKKGFYLKTEDKKMMFFSFALNPLYKFKIIFFLLSVIIIYFLLSFITQIQTKKLEREKLRLEAVIRERTREISNKNVELGLRNNIIEEKQKEILDSINYAKRIQYTLLAHKDVLQQNLSDYFLIFKPKDIVSGDFYWATQHNDKFYLAVCDSTGHGVPGAFMSLLNIGFLSEAIKEKDLLQPNEVLNYVRQRLIDTISKDEQKDGMDAILLCFDKVNGVVTYSAANNQAVIVKNNEIKLLFKDKMPVGKGESTKSFNLYTLDIVKGDTVYLYTDGFADQFGGPKGKKLKYKTLNELLLKNSSLHLSIQAELLTDEFIRWKGDLEQVDDVCLMGIKF